MDFVAVSKTDIPYYMNGIILLFLQEEKQGTRILPYNSYLGCVVLAPDDRFFLAQIGSSFHTKQSPRPIARNDIHLRDVESACIFKNHSMVTLEKRKVGLFKKKQCLREYQIEYRSPHILKHHEVKTLVDLTSNIGDKSQVRAVMDNGDPVVVVVNIDGNAEIVRFTAV